MTAAELFAAIAAACPAGAGQRRDEVLTVIISDTPIGKQFSIAPDGTVKKQAVAAVAEAMACQFHVPDLATLQAVLALVGDHPNAAICNSGWSPVEIGEPFRLVSRKAQEAAGRDPEAVYVFDGIKTFARLKERATPSCWQLVDRDVDRYTPPEFAAMPFPVWREAMGQLLPGFQSVACLRAHSSSSRVMDAESGRPVGEGNGHVWIKVSTPEDVDAVRKTILPRAVLANKLWGKPRHDRKTGAVIGYGDTTITDPSTWVAGRLVFNGKPTVTDDRLTVTDQRFEAIEGVPVLDLKPCLELDVGAVLRHSAAKGRPMVVRNGAQAYRSDLRLDTVLELHGGVSVTVQEAARTGKKLRCQAPFRESSSMAAFFTLDAMGTSFVFDSGTGIKHTLNTGRLPDDVYGVVAKLKARIAAHCKNEDDKRLVRHLIDEALLQAVVGRLFWIADKGKMILVGIDGALLYFTPDQARQFGLKEHFGDLIDRKLLAAFVGADEAGDIMGDQFKYVVEAVIAHRQAQKMTVAVDMFAVMPSVSFADGLVSVTIPHKPFDELRHIPDAMVARVWSDFCEHFPGWQMLVDAMLQSRFVAGTRRRSFIWLRAPSDFGKGLIVATMNRLGLLVGMTIPELGKAMKGDPSGQDPEAFLRAWVLHVDEWKNVTGDLKQLNDTVSIAPKNRMKMTVPVYLKLFTSAEDVTSLTQGGIEKQFAERFSYMTGIEGHRFDDRPLRNEIGSTNYREALAAGMARYLNWQVATMQAMGRESSDRAATSWLEMFHMLHPIGGPSGEFGDYADTIKEAAELCRVNVREWFRKKDTMGSKRGAFADALAVCRLGEYKGAKVIQLSHRAIDEFIRVYASKSGEAKMGYKVAELAALIDEGGQEARKYRIGDPDGSSTRGPLVYLNKL